MSFLRSQLILLVWYKLLLIEKCSIMVFLIILKAILAQFSTQNFGHHYTIF